MQVLNQDITNANKTIPITEGIAPSNVVLSKTAVHVPALATQATITVPAPGAGKAIVCVGITATLACGAAAATPINVYLRDGAAGAGNIIWAGSTASPINGADWYEMPGIAIPGSINTAMTLEFAAAGPAGSQEIVTLQYIIVSFP